MLQKVIWRHKHYDNGEYEKPAQSTINAHG
jgi:hypothetical protein